MKIFIFRTLASFTITLLILLPFAGCAGQPSDDNPSQNTTTDGRTTSLQAENTLKIVIYTDFECGACYMLHSEIEPELRERYIATGRAEIDIRLLGVIDADSLRGAEAALCAADQGYLLEYIDALFGAWRETEDANVFSAEALIALAGSLGLDQEIFRQSLESGSKKPELENNLMMAKADGVEVLPAIIINGTKIEGYKPLDTYARIIDEALEN